MQVREARKNPKVRLYMSQINHRALEKKSKNSCSRGPRGIFDPVPVILRPGHSLVSGCGG